MKPFMGLDLTENNKNTRRNGEKFLIQKASPTTLEKLEKLNADFQITLLLYIFTNKQGALQSSCCNAPFGFEWHRKPFLFF